MEYRYNMPGDIDLLRQENVRLKDELTGYYLSEVYDKATTEFLTAMVKKMKHSMSEHKFSVILMASLYGIHKKYDESDFENVLNNMSRELGFRCREWDDFYSTILAD